MKIDDSSWVESSIAAQKGGERRLSYFSWLNCRATDEQNGFERVRPFLFSYETVFVILNIPKFTFWNYLVHCLAKLWQTFWSTFKKIIMKSNLSTIIFDDVLF